MWHEGQLCPNPDLFGAWEEHFHHIRIPAVTARIMWADCVKFWFASKMYTRNLALSHRLDLVRDQDKPIRNWFKLSLKSSLMIYVMRRVEKLSLKRPNTVSFIIIKRQASITFVLWSFCGRCLIFYLFIVL